VTDAPPAVRKKKKPPRIAFRVVNGTLQPADRWAEQEFRAKGINEGDIVYAAIVRLRSKGLNRLVHRIGKLCAENIEDFAGMDGHAVIKRLQIEANVCCDEIGVLLPDVGMVVYRVPQSIAFDSMDEFEFREAGKALCRYIAWRYWTGLEPEQIEVMAGSMVD
jgi:hypothetical protein